MTSRALKQLETTLLTPTSKSGVTQVQADQEWKHPAELIYSTGRYWTDKKLFYYCIANALSFSAPSSESNSGSESQLSSGPPDSSSPDLLYVSDGKKTVVVNENYRLPLIFLSLWQWNKLRGLLCPETDVEGTLSKAGTSPNSPPRSSSWPTQKFEVLHIARAWKILTDEGPSLSILSTPSYGPAVTKAQRIEGIRRWRCHTLDRILTRFKKGSFSNESGSVERFWEQHGEIEYDTDILEFDFTLDIDWRSWLSEPRDGVPFPPSQFTSGLDSERLMEGLKEKDGVWYWDLSTSANSILPPLSSSSVNAVQIPADAIPASSLRATAGNLFGKAPKRAQSESGSPTPTKSKTPSKSKSPPVKSTPPTPSTLTFSYVSASAPGPSLSVSTPATPSSSVSASSPWSQLEKKPSVVIPPRSKKIGPLPTLPGQHRRGKKLDKPKLRELQTSVERSGGKREKEESNVGATSSIGKTHVSSPKTHAPKEGPEISSPREPIDPRASVNTDSSQPFSGEQAKVVKIEGGREAKPEIQETQNPPRVRRAQNAISTSAGGGANGVTGSPTIPQKSSPLVQTVSGSELGKAPQASLPSMPPKPSTNSPSLTTNSSPNATGLPSKPIFGPPPPPHLDTLNSDLKSNSALASGEKEKSIAELAASASGGDLGGNEKVAKESIGPPRTKPKPKLPDFTRNKPQVQQEAPSGTPKPDESIPAALKRKASGSSGATPIPTPAPTPTPSTSSAMDVDRKEPESSGGITMPIRTPSRSGIQSPSPVTPTFVMRPNGSASNPSSYHAATAQPPVPSPTESKTTKGTGKPVLQVSTSSPSITRPPVSSSPSTNTSIRRNGSVNRTGGSNGHRPNTPPSPTSPIYAKSNVPLPPLSGPTTSARTPTPTGNKDNKLKRSGSPLEKPGPSKTIDSSWYSWSTGPSKDKEPEPEMDEIPGLGNFPSPAYTSAPLPIRNSPPPSSSLGLGLGLKTGSGSASNSSVNSISGRKEKSSEIPHPPAAVTEPATTSLPTPFSASSNKRSFSLDRPKPPSRASTAIHDTPSTSTPVPVPMVHLLNGNQGRDGSEDDKMDIDKDAQTMMQGESDAGGTWDVSGTSGFKIHPMHPLAHLLG
ncbi:hypothetical protein GYMLUDRAFT_237152 [Collybiopsis luxurians FD-317 M1]|nr:hypothetical protein GYMLUDRAFT_237152 [Collybiopsis luxurians FD-317 M1]